MNCNLLYWGKKIVLDKFFKKINKKKIKNNNSDCLFNIFRFFELEDREDVED